MLKTNVCPSWVEWLKKETNSEPNFNDWAFHGDCEACSAFNMYALISEKDERGVERHHVFCRFCGTEVCDDVQPWFKDF